ncbi:MAG: ATP-grasp domain-containing protein [Candidatus Nezhaarchaeales archaeon]
MRERRVLLTGAGGIGGVNFVRSLRLAENHYNERFFIVGTDFNTYYIELPEVDLRFRAPRHTSADFIPTLIKLATSNKLEFLHPHPSPEAKVVSENREKFEELGVTLYLPRPEDIMPDKFHVYRKLSSAGVNVPKTIHVKLVDDVDAAFAELDKPLWIRAMKGAGGRLSLKVNSPEEAKMWIKLNVVQGRARQDEFIIQEYLPGRDLAFDSLWFKGELITSYLRERLEYPFKHISLSGLTGTPSVARILRDENVSRIAISAVKALNPSPHGFYSVDLKEGADGLPKVTEVDGKWHTTAPLWGYAFAKAYNKPSYNIAYTYLRLGYGEGVSEALPKTDLFLEEHYLIRQMDSGVVLKSKERSYRVV